MFSQGDAALRRVGEYPPGAPRPFQQHATRGGTQMNLHQKLIAALLALTALVPLTARADDDDWGRGEREERRERHERWERRDQPCEHGASVVPGGQPSNPGHYETRSVQT